PSCASSRPARGAPRRSKALSMAEPVPFEKQAKRLQLRGRPKPVTEINRKLVIAGVAVGAALLFLAASVALDPPTVAGKEEPRELYNTRNKPKAEALSALPSTYDQMPPQKPFPLLGPPIPGDLGGAILAAERILGVEPAPATGGDEDFRPDPVSEA